MWTYRTIFSNKFNGNWRLDVAASDKTYSLIDEIIEKPISQWNKEEIKKFAALKDIDISGTKNATEAKELIKQFLEENN